MEFVEPIIEHMWNILTCVLRWIVKIWFAILNFIDPPLIRIYIVGDHNPAISSILDSFDVKHHFSSFRDTIHNHNKRTVQVKNVIIIKQDVYQHKIQHNFMKGQTVRGLVIVMDSSTEKGCKWVKKEILEKVLPSAKPYLKVLIFANKQDVKGALKIDQIMKLLKMEDYPQKDWFIMVRVVIILLMVIKPSVTTTGDGIYEGFEWLFSKIAENGSES